MLLRGLFRLKASKQLECFNRIVAHKLIDPRLPTGRRDGRLKLFSKVGRPIW